VKAKDKTEEKLIRELRQRIAELEKSENHHQREMEKLLASENKYKVLIENLPQKIFHKDRNSVYVSCNENYANDLKIKPDEIVEKTDYDFYTKELAEKYRADDKRIMELGETEYIEEKYIQNGQEQIVPTVKTPIKDEKGSAIGILGIFWDITERKKTEIALEGAIVKAQEERNKSEAIISAIGDGIIIQDTDYKILYQNKIQNDLYGNRVGDYCYKTYEGKDAICEDCPIELSFKDGKIHKAERRVPTDNGISYAELTGSSLKDSTGKIIAGIKIVRDITQSKRIEEALRQSEEKYRVLFEAAPMGIGIADLRGNMLDGNQSMQEMTGFTLEELKSISIASTYVNPDERKFLLKTLQETGRVRDWEVRLKRKDGAVYYALLNADLLELNGHKVLLTTARDITERKKADIEKDRFLKAFASSTDGITIADEKDRFIYVNEAYSKIFGYNQEELIGKTWRKITPSEMIAPTEEGLSNTMHKKDVGLFCGEVPGLRKDGTIIPTEVRGKGLWDENGNYQGHICIVRDITERKRMVEELHRAHDELELRIQERTAELVKTNETLQSEITERKSAEEKYRTLIDNIQDGVFIIQDGKMQFVNEAFAKVCGYTVEEVMGKDFAELVAPEDLEMVADRYRRRQTGEDVTKEYEFHMMHKDERTRILVNMNVGLITYRGRVASMGTVKDITEKKRLESQLLRAQRMESIGTLAGGIAHDINNVLTPIMLSQELLQEKLTDVESKRLLNTIRKSTHRGANLMKQVLSFTKGIEGERNALQVANLISEIRQMAKETFPRNIEIKTDIPKDLWTISGDATQLHQVLMNLCVNARDAMLDGGILSISVENLFIDEDYARMNSEAKIGPYIVITVSDTGIGIPAKLLDRIFEPFFTTKEHGKGTGLGLSTSHGIVKSHGGFINVYSEVGKGTAFKVYLPAITTNETLKAQEHQHELPAGHGELILVVDDEEQILEITKKTLEKHGYNVITANNGEEAIALYSQHKDEIKVVLMDMMMPVMDGSASIRELCKVNPEVKIIAVSGLTEKDKFARVDDVHVQAFLTKPYAAEKLLNAIYDIISTK
jgi:PAS domain S-box-containing protein